MFDANGSVDLVVTREGHAVTRSGVIGTWGKGVIDEVLEQKSEIERLKNVCQFETSLAESDASLNRLHEAASLAMEESDLG